MVQDLRVGRDGISGWMAMVVGVIGVIVAFLAWQLPKVPSSPSSSSTVIAGTDRSTSQPRSTRPTPKESGTTDSETPATASAGHKTTAPEAPLEPAAIDEINVVVTSSSVTYGDRVGPNTFQLKNGWHAMQISYQWTSFASGIQVSGNDCAVVTKVDGPVALSGIRSASCTRGRPNQFATSDGILTGVTPGTYSIEVSETLSGVTGTVSFTVLP